MDKQKADEILTEYFPKIYGFDIKKAFYYAETEEICATIVEQLYESLVKAKEIYNLDGYIWRISEYIYCLLYTSNEQEYEAVRPFLYTDRLLASAAALLREFHREHGNEGYALWYLSLIHL